MREKILARKKQFLIGAILAVVLVLIFWFYPRPLTEQLGLESFESTVSADLGRSNWVEQENGSKIIEDMWMELKAEPDDPAVQELYEVMSEIRAVRRWRLPFEKVTVYHSGYDSFSMKFSVNGKRVVLDFLADTHTIYDTGIRNQQFHVSPDSFEKLAAVIEKYGVLVEN